MDLPVAINALNCLDQIDFVVHIRCSRLLPTHTVPERQVRCRDCMLVPMSQGDHGDQGSQLRSYPDKVIEIREAKYVSRK